MTFSIIEVETWKIYLGLILTSLFTGIGSALGSYLSTRFVIKRFDRTDRTKRKKKRK